MTKLKFDKRILFFIVIAVIGILAFSNFTPVVEGTTPIYQILSDYQDYPNGGNGYLRIMTFNSAENRIEITTFSPYLNAYKTGANSNFNLDYTLSTLPDGSMAPISAPFTIIVLPDTQYYSAYHTDIFLNQTNWIVQNQQNLNIKFVIHLGDIVDNFNNHGQWTAAYNAMMVLKNNNIPFSVLAGNHDYVEFTSSMSTSNYYQFTQSIGLTPQGSLNNDNFNTYYTFSVGTNQFLVLSLSFNPSQTTLDWANQIISQNPDCKGILATHEYLDSGGRTAIGERIFNSFVKQNECQIVLCGHNAGEMNTFASLFGIDAKSGGENLKVDKI